MADVIEQYEGEVWGIPFVANPMKSVDAIGARLINKAEKDGDVLAFDTYAARIFGDEQWERILFSIESERGTADFDTVGQFLQDALSSIGEGGEVDAKNS